MFEGPGHVCLHIEIEMGTHRYPTVCVQEKKRLVFEGTASQRLGTVYLYNCIYTNIMCPILLCARRRSSSSCSRAHQLRTQYLGALLFKRSSFVCETLCVFVCAQEKQQLVFEGTASQHLGTLYLYNILCARRRRSSSCLRARWAAMWRRSPA